MWSAILPASISAPRSSELSSVRALTSTSDLPSPSVSFPQPPPSLPPIRMGGGPRTYPGGVSKWQWKRMQAKKSKQLLKARLCRERQIYEMRKRAELKAAVSELERPWEVVERAPTLFSVKADEQVKVLADRFQRADGFDLWSERDGPKVLPSFHGLPSGRFFPKGVVHSVGPYGVVDEEGLGFGDSTGRHKSRRQRRGRNMTKSSDSSGSEDGVLEFGADRIGENFGRNSVQKRFQSTNSATPTKGKGRANYTAKRNLSSQDRFNGQKDNSTGRGRRSNGSKQEGEDDFSLIPSESSSFNLPIRRQGNNTWKNNKEEFLIPDYEFANQGDSRREILASTDSDGITGGSQDKENSSDSSQERGFFTRNSSWPTEDSQFQGEAL